MTIREELQLEKKDILEKLISFNRDYSECLTKSDKEDNISIEKNKLVLMLEHINDQLASVSMAEIRAVYENMEDEDMNIIERRDREKFLNKHK